MKTLKTIQVLAKLGRVLSKIVFIFCVIGFCGCAVGLLSLALGLETASLQLGKVTILGPFADTAGLDRSALCAAMACGLILCAFEGVLSKFAEVYFRRELADGTPFTLRGAKELLRLGILAVVLPLAAGIACSAALAQAKLSRPALEAISFDGFSSVALGIMLMVLSLFCRYGAEQFPGSDGPEGARR